MPVGMGKFEMMVFVVWAAPAIGAAPPQTNAVIGLHTAAVFLSPEVGRSFQVAGASSEMALKQAGIAEPAEEPMVGIDHPTVP